MSCLSCARDLHEECQENTNPEWPCCCEVSEESDTPIFSEVVAGPSPEASKKKGRPPKPGDEISVSAGRKRAAELYGNQMGSNWPCEWRLMVNCGGGAKPIPGCVGGTREHIHHGPVKDTWRNERANISLICTQCHNRWHTANDPIYDKEANESLPKAPRLMTIAESLEALKIEIDRKK